MSSLNTKLKRKIWKRDNFKCKYCGENLTLETATVDHVIPRWKGGGGNQDNLVTSCRPCNLKKEKRERPLLIYKK